MGKDKFTYTSAGELVLLSSICECCKYENECTLDKRYRKGLAKCVRYEVKEHPLLSGNNGEADHKM